MNNQNSIQFLKKVGAFTGLAIGAFALSAFAWTMPTEAPPGGNVAAPINVGSLNQIKKGSLTLNTDGSDAYGLDVLGKFRLLGNLEIGTKIGTNGTSGKIRIQDGTQGNGKVLTSDADGLASWATPASGSAAQTIVASQQYTLTQDNLDTNPSLDTSSQNLGNQWDACFITGTYRNPINSTSAQQPFGCSVLNGGTGWIFSILGNKSESNRGVIQCYAQCINLQ